MTTIVAANFDWSIESCDKAPRDLNYERKTEKYGRAMKLTLASEKFTAFIFSNKKPELRNLILP